MMKTALLLLVLICSTYSNAGQSVEDKLFTDLNRSIAALGARIAACTEGSERNKPDNNTLEFAQKNLEELTPVLAHINNLAIERCSLNEKKELAYRMLITKNSTRRQSTLKLIQATEKMAFSLSLESQAKLDALSNETKTYLTNSHFFTKPFDVVALYESLSD